MLAFFRATTERCKFRGVCPAPRYDVRLGGLKFGRASRHVKARFGRRAPASASEINIIDTAMAFLQTFNETAEVQE